MLRIRPSSLASGLIAVAVALFALDASAAVHWNSQSHQYDSFGAKPGTAVGWSYPNEASWAVEVHQGQNGYGPLWYRAGFVGSLGNSAQIPGINGYNPTIATLSPYVFGSSQPAGYVVVAYQNQQNPGEMSYVIGTWNYNSPWTVSWSSETNFVFNTENGYYPSITACYSANGTGVACAYRNGTGFGPIQYKTATYSNGSIGPWTSQTATDNGVNASISCLADHMVEVHQGQDAVGPLWFRSGTFNSNGTISYGGATHYDSGLNPTVAVSQVYSNPNSSPILLVEAHQIQSGSGALWSQTANYNATTNQWSFNGDSTNYDQGALPQVAAGPVCVGSCNPTITTGWEVHQGGASAAPLWYRTFTLTVP